MAERRQNTTGRSGVGDKALAFKPTGRGFAPRQRFVFFTRPRRQRVLIYQSYYRRKEKNTTGRSGVGDKALAFKPTGRGFAPRQRFVFFTRPRRRRVSIYQSYYRREEKNTTGRSGVGVRRLNLPLPTCSFLSPLFVFFTRRRTPTPLRPVVFNLISAII